MQDQINLEQRITALENQINEIQEQLININKILNHDYDRLSFVSRNAVSKAYLA